VGPVDLGAKNPVGLPHLALVVTGQQIGRALERGQFGSF
jgi:hypothetical protein